MKAAWVKLASLLLLIGLRSCIFVDATALMFGEEEFRA